MYNCKICKTDFETIRDLSNHLRFTEKITAKDYYDKYLKKEGEGICTCGNPTQFDSLATGYKHHCSRKCSNSDNEVLKKQQATTLKNYGVLHPAQSKEVKKKMQDTCIEKYGASNGHGEKQKEQIRQTNLEKYGVECSFQAKEVIEKSKQTKKERYGSETYTNRDKFKTTIQEKYGVSDLSHTPDWEKKVSDTKQERYGDAKYNNSSKGQETKRTNSNAFEKENNCTSVLTLNKQYGTGWTQVPLYKEIVVINDGRAYVKNTDIPKIVEYYEEAGSHFEKSVYDFIKSIYNGEIIRRSRKIIPPQEIDIYIPEKKIGIEVNGTYYHSSQFGVSKNYHFNKSKACQKQGIRLIHIYEWEWLKYPEKIKQLLNISLSTVSKIYARDCVIKTISNAEAKPFNEATHLQGHRNAQVTYGLFYKGKLVQLMSFSKTKYNRNLGENDWEIIRGCPGSNNIVIGGVSKLFKHFVEDYNPDNVFSYCDFNKFDGKSYLALGMKFVGYTNPNKWWVMPDKTTVIERNPKKYNELKGNNTVWGSGSLKFLWTAEEHSGEHSEKISEKNSLFNYNTDDSVPSEKSEIASCKNSESSLIIGNKSNKTAERSMRKMEKDIEKKMKKQAKEMEKLRKKSNKIPKETILMDKTDRVWNFIPLGVTVRKNKEVPVGWYLNDQNIVEGVYQTLPSTSVLIAGGTGSGKTVVEANIITHINEFKSNFQLIGVDCKRVEFNHIRNKFDGVLETPEDTADAVKVVQSVMMQRFKLMEKYRVNSIYALTGIKTIKVPYYTIKGLGKYQFDTIFTGVHTTKKSRTSNGITMTIEDIYSGLTEGLFDKVRYESIVITPENIEKVEGFYIPKNIVFMVDEMSTLMLIDDYRTVDTIKNTIGSIARLGRAAGVHLVLCCQRASGSVIWSDLKNNCQMNILLGGFDKEASILALDEDLSDYCRPDIRGRGFIGSGNDIIETQIYAGRITRY